MQWIYGHPKLAQMVGQALFSASGFILISGLIGRAALTALNRGRVIDKLPQYTGIADAYPSAPLWWVPESALGYAFCVIVAAMGVYLTLKAKQVLRSTSKRRRA